MTLDDFLKQLIPKEQALFNKLWELTKRGIGGERENAEWFIKQFCSKRGVEFGNLELEERTKRTFTGIRLSGIFANIVAKVLNSWDISVWHYKKSPTTKTVLCNPMEYAEIKLMYEIYAKAWQKELKKLHIAFVHKHNLFPAVDFSENEKDDLQVLSDKEVRDLKKKQAEQQKKRQLAFEAFQMMNGLSDVEVQKRIGQDETE